MHFLIISMECINSIKKYYFILIFPFVKIFGFIKLIDIHVVQHNNRLIHIIFI